MKHSIHYQITLSAPQLEYLAGSKYHKNRMAFFLDLVKSAVLKSSKSLLPGCDKIIVTGQVEKSEVQLANDWDCDRKTVSKVIGKMNELGIITTEKSNRTSVHIIHPVAAWIVDNVRIRNPHFRTGYDYRKIHEGAFECIPDAENFIKDFESINQEEIPIQCSKNSKNFPKGKSVNKYTVVRQLPTIKNFEKYEQRENEISSTQPSSNVENTGGNGEKWMEAQSFLPSFSPAHSNEESSLRAIQSNSDTSLHCVKDISVMDDAEKTISDEKINAERDSNSIVTKLESPQLLFDENSEA
ncbi:MAG: hypothetical protein Q4E63_09870 [Prevotellaceae bacterium]|nr:hypothetical protein [Prevotellaceae bacterium]